MGPVTVAKKAIERVFSDTSVSPEETAERMKELHEIIMEYIQMLREDGVDC